MLSHQHVACYTPSLCGSCLPSTASTSSSAANRWCSTQGTVHPQDRHGGHHMQQSCVHLPGGLPLFVPVRSVPSSTTQRSHASAEHRQRAVDVLELGKVFRLLVAVRWAGGGEQLCEDGRAATTDGAHDTRTCSIAAHVQSRPSQPRTCHSAVVDRTVRPEWAMRSTCPTSAVDREGGGGGAHILDAPTQRPDIRYRVLRCTMHTQCDRDDWWFMAVAQAVRLRSARRMTENSCAGVLTRAWYAVSSTSQNWPLRSRTGWGPPSGTRFVTLPCGRQARHVAQSQCGASGQCPTFDGR